MASILLGTMNGIDLQYYYIYPIAKNGNWIPVHVIGRPHDCPPIVWQIGMQRTNHRKFCVFTKIQLKINNSPTVLLERISMPSPWKTFWFELLIWKFQFSFIFCLRVLVFGPTSPQNFQWLSMRWAWIFSGITQCCFLMNLATLSWPWP